MPARKAICHIRATKELLADMAVMPDWFTNLLAMDLAQKLAPKFVGNDPYIKLTAKDNLAMAWMDALKGNGGDTYFEGPGGEADGSTDSYEGFRISDEL